MIAGTALMLIAAAAHSQERPSAPRPAPDDRAVLPELPPAQIDNDLAIGGEDVAARKVETRLSVEVGINGTGPYKFIVDSGADSSAVGLKLANQLGLPLSTPVTLYSITSRDIVDRVEVETMELGPNTIYDMKLPVLREQDMGGDGMIGIDALSGRRLMMDFDKKVIRVEDARQRVRSEPGEIVIVGRRQKGQLILTEVDASGVQLDAIIDTGSQVTIGNSALRAEFSRRKLATIAKTQIIGVTGQKEEIEIAMLKQVTIGPITLRNVTIAFADVRPFAAFGLADEPALLLGTDILEKFSRVSLDFRSRKVRFQLRKCAARAVSVGPATTGASRIKANDPVACR